MASLSFSGFEKNEIVWRAEGTGWFDIKRTNIIYAWWCFLWLKLLVLIWGMLFYRNPAERERKKILVWYKKKKKHTMKSQITLTFF
jgi:hypothetical protein